MSSATIIASNMLGAVSIFDLEVDESNTASAQFMLEEYEDFVPVLSPELEPFNTYIDDNGTDLLDEVVNEIFPMYLRANLPEELGTTDSAFLNNTILGSASCSDVSGDIFFPEPPDEEDYPEGQDAPEYRLLLTISSTNRAQAKQICETCPLAKVCLTKAIVEAEAFTRETEELYASQVKEPGYTRASARREAKQIFYPGIYGGYDSYERGLITSRLTEMWNNVYYGIVDSIDGLEEADDNWRSSMTKEEVYDWAKAALSI